jgi:hypothetical protein
MVMMAIMMMGVVRVPLLQGEGRGVDLRTLLLLLLPPLYLLSHTFVVVVVVYISFYLGARIKIWTRFVFVLSAPVLGVLHC